MLVSYPVRPRSLTIKIPGGKRVSALLLKPRNAAACFVFAHGAGSGMEHPFMSDIAARLAILRIATLRYQFPFIETGSRRPDRPAVCHETVRSAVASAGRNMPGSLLIAGGKSFGGRMTSQAQALEALPGVVGLVFFGFPWHPPRAPSAKRGEHLRAISVPMLFLQGSRDALGDQRLVRAAVRKLRNVASLHSVPDADHGFHVPIKSGRTDLEIRDDLVGALAEWVDAIAKSMR